MFKPRVTRWVNLAALALAVCFIVDRTWPIAAQAPNFIVQLANGAASGSGLETQRAASLANFALATATTARNVVGVQLVTKPSSWTVVSNPAAGSVASASIAAEAGVRHVADCITFAGDSSGAVTAAAATVNLRDGATGAGTVIAAWAQAIAVAAGAGIEDIPPFGMCGLNLVGTTNTAMTLEFTAGATNFIESVTLTGYNVQ